MPSTSTTVGPTPSSTTPAAASATHNRSMSLLEPSTASAKGPTNSSVTARPIGIRWKLR